MTSWDYDGMPISDFGVVTLLDDYLDAPEKRGGNMTIPYLDGELFVEKYYKSRSIRIGLAIKAANASELETRLDNLKKLLYGRGQKILSNQRADGSVRTILASVDGSLNVNRESYNFLRLVIDFNCASPFFRSDTLTSVEQDIDETPKTMTIENTGTAPELDAEITLTAPLKNVSIYNPLNGTRVTYSGQIDTPRYVVIQTVNGEFTATDDTGNNKIGLVTHENSAALLEIETGVNELLITSETHTTGKVRIRFYPPFL